MTTLDTSIQFAFNSGRLDANAWASEFLGLIRCTSAGVNIFERILPVTQIIVSDDLNIALVNPGPIQVVSSGAITNLAYVDNQSVLYIWINPNVQMVVNGQPVSSLSLYAHELAHWIPENRPFVDANGFVRQAVGSLESENAAQASANFVNSSLGLPEFAYSDLVATNPPPGMRAIYSYFRPKCFSGDTLVRVPAGDVVRISDLRVDHWVSCYHGVGGLSHGKITREIHGVTTEWIVLEDGTRVTPSHQYLRPDGSFMLIGEIVAGDGMVVDAEGRPKRITGQLLRATDAGSDAAWIEPEPTIQGNTLVRHAPVFGWRTYNLTVQGHHTYIAGGLRVHNDCWLDSDQLLDVQVAQDGTVTWIGRSETGADVHVREYWNPATSQVTAVTRDEIFDGGNGATVTATWRDFDANNNVLDVPPEIEVRHAGDIVTAEQIGTLFGSTLGQALGGGNPFVHVGASSVIGTLGENVWESLRNWSADVSYTQGELQAGQEFTTHVEMAFSNFGAELLTRIRAQGIGAVSAFLTAELAEELGFNDGSFGGQLASYTASTTISSVLDVALHNIGLNTGAFEGLGGLLFQSPGAGVVSPAGIAAGFGTFLGTYLAHEVVEAVSTSGAIGSQVGSGGARDEVLGFGVSIDTRSHRFCTSSPYAYSAAAASLGPAFAPRTSLPGSAPVALPSRVTTFPDTRVAA